MSAELKEISMGAVDHGAFTEFAIAINDACEETCEENQKASAENAKAAADKAVKLLRQRSKRSRGGGKHYNTGWVADSDKADTGGYGETSYLVHNKTKPGLTHLLEKGHAIVVHGKHLGRSTTGDHVIEKVADEIASEFYKMGGDGE